MGGAGADNVDGRAGNDQIYGDATVNSRYENGVNRFNVDDDPDNTVTANDVLRIVNFINARPGGGSLVTTNDSNLTAYVDVDGDELCTASDVLAVVNYINSHGSGRGEGFPLVTGAGNDILIGGSGDDRLSGDQGRDLLIGGVGSDRIQGGQDEDILIGGNIQHAADLEPLDALMTIWGQNQPQPGRIQQLRSAGLNTQNIPDDQAVDQLLGQDNLDWFWEFATDTSDRKKDEQLR
jgi:Ca2+-binding RTX toxin-like protein